mmetsp:Transcript_7944/g.33197  ORF Transcript_7944/g.33197 Transcript_7944/m.33197 type:complete len:483 (+) Transcript_7944:2740-4188(+)
MNRPLALSPRSDPPPLSPLRQKVERPRPPPERLHDEPERRDHGQAAVLDLDGLQNRQIFVRHVCADAERIKQLPARVHAVEVREPLERVRPRPQRLRDHEQRQVQNRQPHDLVGDRLAEVRQRGPNPVRAVEHERRVPPVLPWRPKQRQLRRALWGEHAHRREHRPAPVDELALAQFHDVPLRAHLKGVPAGVAGHLAGQIRGHGFRARQVQQRGGHELATRLAVQARARQARPAHRRGHHQRRRAVGPVRHGGLGLARDGNGTIRGSADRRRRRRRSPPAAAGVVVVVPRLPGARLVVTRGRAPVPARVHGPDRPPVLALKPGHHALLLRGAEVLGERREVGLLRRRLARQRLGGDARRVFLLRRLHRSERGIEVRLAETHARARGGEVRQQQRAELPVALDEARQREHDEFGRAQVVTQEPRGEVLGKPKKRREEVSHLLDAQRHEQFHAELVETNLAPGFVSPQNLPARSGRLHGPAGV